MDNNKYTEILYSNSDLAKRRRETEKVITKLSSDFEKALKKENTTLSIFSAGSIGRYEIGLHSDVDPFVLADSAINSMDEDKIKKNINTIANDNGFPDITEDFFKIYKIEDLLSLTGKSDDDKENTFTTRILMLLESLPIYNADAYIRYRERVVRNYFRDSEGRAPEFKPVFLINDFLRYWRTVCLNYEKLRNDPNKPWRKKNINLKFARRFTIFSTLSPMIAKPIRSVEEFIAICDMTPMERLAYGLSVIDDPSLEERYKKVVEYYETFLRLKEESNIEDSLNIVKPKVREMDEFNKRFLFDVLMHKAIDDEYKHCLVM